MRIEKTKFDYGHLDWFTVETNHTSTVSISHWDVVSSVTIDYVLTRNLSYISLFHRYKVLTTAQGILLSAIWINEWMNK